MRAPPAAVKIAIGAFALDRFLDALHERRADRDAHRSAHIGEILHADHDILAIDLAGGVDERILIAGGWRAPP
jgi:hypothetical protein